MWTDPSLKPDDEDMGPIRSLYPACLWGAAATLIHFYRVGDSATLLPKEVR